MINGSRAGQLYLLNSAAVLEAAASCTSVFAEGLKKPFLFQLL